MLPEDSHHADILATTPTPNSAPIKALRIPSSQNIEANTPLLTIRIHSRAP